MFKGKSLRSLFKRGGRDWIILIFSLLLAFFMWSIQKLSQDYSTYLRYSLYVHSNLVGRVESAPSSDLVVVKGKASGFYIFQHLFGKEKGEVIDINVEARQLIKMNGSTDKFFIKSNDLKTKVSEALGDVFQIESFVSDTVFFSFPKQSYKKVPVIAKEALRYKNQYMAFSPITLKPDSILIYGQTSIIRTIDSVFTNIIKGDKLDSPITGLVQLLPIDGVRFSLKEAYYSQEIGRYVEKKINIKVACINTPPNRSVAVLPQEVTLKYRTTFYGKNVFDASEFSVVIDYMDITNDNYVRPVLRRAPKGAYSVKIEPNIVECIIN